MKHKTHLAGCAVTEVTTASLETSATHPLYTAQPAAGFPSPGDDEVERSLDLNELLIDNPSATFFVRVSGDSMEGARVFDGDILVVDRALTPQSGSIVVAAVFGELVVKRLHVMAGKAELRSENNAYAPIAINDNEDYFVWGVVVGSVRVLP